MRWDCFSFHKNRDSFTLLQQLSAIGGNLSLYPSLHLPKNTFLPSIWSRREYMCSLNWKKSLKINLFLSCRVYPIPTYRVKKDDEHFVNAQLYFDIL